MNNLELYHGTISTSVVLVLAHEEDLFGVRDLRDPRVSGTLTNDLQTAQISSWGAESHGLFPIVLKFHIPKDLLIYEGPIGNNDKSVVAYSTILSVKPTHLSIGYLQSLCISVDEAIRRVSMKTHSFFRIPHEYLVGREYLPRLGLPIG